MAYTTTELLAYIERDFKKNEHAFDSGRRNNDAVNLSIMCHCVGINQFDVFERMREDFDWDWMKYALAKEHMHRVEPYLDKWGKPGTMEAMLFCLDY